MTITSPNPVSKAWRGPCVLRLRSIPGQPTRCPRPKARSAGEKEQIMSIYAVYEPPLRAHESAPNPERFVFVRDGFSLWAFLLAPFWMLRHRLWLAFLAYVVVALALLVGLRLIAASPTLTIVVSTLLALLVGFEAATLRRFTLSRRGWRNVGIVVGDDLESAERRFFDAWVNKRSVEKANPEPAASSPAWGAPLSPRTASEVIGLFPQSARPQ